MSGSRGSSWRADRARICWTSRMVREGLSASIIATTPETCGAEKEVPANKVEVT